MRFAAVFAAVLSLGLAAVAAPTAGVQSLEVASVAPMGVVARDVSAPLVARVDAEAASITTLPARDEDFITFLKGKQAQIKTVTDDIRAKTGAKETNIDAYKPDISQIIAYIDDITASTKVHISKNILTDILDAVQSIVGLVEVVGTVLRLFGPHIVDMILALNLNLAFVGFQIAVTYLTGVITTLFMEIHADLGDLSALAL